MNISLRLFFVIITFLTTYLISPPLQAPQIQAYMFGHYYNKKNNPGKAEEWFKKALFSAPVSQYAYKGYIDYLFSTKQYRNIIALIPNLTEHFHHDESVQLLFAQSLLYEGKMEEGQRLFIELGQRFKTNQVIVFQAAQIYLQKKELTNAINMIDTYLNSCPRRPNNFIFHFLKSQAYLLAQNPPKALEAIKESINIFPAFDKGWLLFGMLQEQVGNLEQAIKGFSTYLSLSQTVNQPIKEHLAALLMQQKIAGEQHHNTGHIHFQKAVYYCNNREYQPALHELDRCLVQEPKHIQARLLKIQLHAKEHAYQTVLELLRNWILEDPHNGLWYHTAYLLHTNMEFPHTLLHTLYKTVATTHIQVLLPYLYLADYYLKQEQKNEAVAALQHAYTLCTDIPLKTKIAYQIGVIWYEQKAYQQAKTILLEAEALHADFAPLLNLLAYYFASKERNLVQAESRIARVLELDPHNPHFQDTQAVIWYKKGEYQKAVALLQQASQRCPEDPIVMRHLAKAHYKCGNSKQAQETLTLASNKGNDIEQSKNKKLLELWNQKQP